MQTIAAFVHRFDALGAKQKARWISGVCAILGILTGFVFYVVLTRTFEQGRFGLRLIALIVGLGLAIFVARTAEWLSETINSGQAELGKMMARAAPTAILLLLVFELCVSTFDEFAKSAVGDFDAVRDIAARVAGQAGDRAAFDAGDDRIAALRSNVAASLSAGNLPAADTAEGRLLNLMQMRFRLPAFYGAANSTDDDIAMLGIVLAVVYPAPRLGGLVREDKAPPWARGCRNNLSAPTVLTPLPPSSRSVWGTFNALAPDRRAQISACRAALSAMTAAERTSVFAQGLNAELRLHDLYDASIFGDDTKNPVIKEAAAQRALCDSIRTAALAKGKRVATCLDAVIVDKDIAAQFPGLLPRDKIMPLNRELLARALPNAFERVPVRWLDLFFLIAMWCTAAVALGLFLCDSVFDIAPKTSLLSAWKTSAVNAASAIIIAPLIAGGLLVALRFILYVIALMFDTKSVAPTEVWEGISVVFQSVPLAVSWLDAGGLFNLHIPGYVSLPVVVIALIAVAASGNESLNSFAAFALFGIFIGGVGPVLGGILMVMLLILVTWLVPAFGLATLLPYLEPAARVPKWWGGIALAVAVVLAIWAAWRWWGIFFGDNSEILSPTLLVAASFSLALTSIFILREHPTIRDLWPLVAITVAFCLLGGALGLQQATFYGIVRELSGVTAPSASEAMQRKTPLTEPNIFSYLYEGESAPEADVVPSEEQERAEVREAAHLELALVGALGFWLTIALLASWSLREHEEARKGAAAKPLEPVAQTS